MLFKVKFFGTKEYRGQITKQTEYVNAPEESAIEGILKNSHGYQKINNLKIRKVENEKN
jgi:hypothetical protein